MVQESAKLADEPLSAGHFCWAARGYLGLGSLAPILVLLRLFCCRSLRGTISDFHWLDEKRGRGRLSSLRKCEVEY